MGLDESDRSFSGLNKSCGVQIRRIRKWKNRKGLADKCLESCELIDIDVQIVKVDQAKGYGGWPSIATRGQ